MFSYGPQMKASQKSLVHLSRLVDPKMKIMSLMTHPHVVPGPQDLRSCINIFNGGTEISRTKS